MGVCGGTSPSPWRGPVGGTGWFHASSNTQIGYPSRYLYIMVTGSSCQRQTFCGGKVTALPLLSSLFNV